MSEISPNILVSMPSQLFTLASKFQAASNGSIYVGNPDTDPLNPENRVPIYIQQESGEFIQIPQPVKINQAGQPTHNGNIIKILTENPYSMLILDSYGSQQFYFDNVVKYDPDRVVNELSKHKTDPKAHKEIQESFDKKLQDHESDVSAHPALMAEAESKIKEHNKSTSAHPELKGYLVGELNRIDSALDDFMQTSLASSRVFATVQDGLSETQNGQHFNVVGKSPSYVDLYLNKNGVAEFVNSMPDVSAIQGVNVMPDPTFNVLHYQNGFYNGSYVFRNMNGAPKFLDESQLGLYTGTSLYIESGYISLQYKVDDIILLKGKRIFLNSLISNNAAASFSVYFRNGAQVISQNSIQVQPSISTEAKVYIDVPVDSFDTFEIRWTSDNEIEVGYVLASYGAYPIAVKSEFVHESISPTNMLHDANNEISSKVPRTVDHIWYMGGSEKRRFGVDPNGYCGVNSLILEGYRLDKLYDISDEKLKIGETVTFSCLCYSSGVSEIFIQLRDSNEVILQTHKFDIVSGENEVIINTTIRFDNVSKLRIVMAPGTTNTTMYVNGFYFGYSPKTTRQSASTPEKYRVTQPVVLPDNLIPDSKNELSMSPSIGNRWYSGKFNCPLPIN